MLFVVEFDTTRECSKNIRHGCFNFQARILNFQARRAYRDGKLGPARGVVTRQ